MGSNSFEQIGQALLEQKRIKEQLQEENRRLKQQLADLRTGQGVFVEIDGKRFALAGEVATTIVVEEASADTSAALATTNVPDLPTTEDQTLVALTDEKQYAPVPTLKEEDQPPVTSAAWGEDQPSAMASMQESYTQDHVQDQTLEAVKQPTFLEEVMLDEFAAALTAPIAALTVSGNTTAEEEEKKAALRRELMGSFLLE